MEELSTIQSKIYENRGQRVMLDFDLAVMYQIPTKALKPAVKRNIDRFLANFMFRLTADERNELVTKCDRLPDPTLYPLQTVPGRPTRFALSIQRPNFVF